MYSDAGRGPEALTQQEAAVTALVVEGLTNREIADRLFLSVKTVSTYRARILQKLGFKNTAELIQYAIRHEITF